MTKAFVETALGDCNLIRKNEKIINDIILKRNARIMKVLKKYRSVRRSFPVTTILRIGCNFLRRGRVLLDGDMIIFRGKTYYNDYDIWYKGKSVCHFASAIQHVDVSNMEWLNRLEDLCRIVVYDEDCLNIKSKMVLHSISIDDIKIHEAFENVDS